MNQTETTIVELIKQGKYGPAAELAQKAKGTGYDPDAVRGQLLQNADDAFDLTFANSYVREIVIPVFADGSLS